MRVSFLLPGFPLHPVGGYRVVYEHANGLVARGHDVAVVHPRGVGEHPTARRRVYEAGWPLLRARARLSGVPWFRLDPRVRLLTTRDLRSGSVPDGDAVVATSWPTAGAAALLPPAKGRGLYLIQHHEVWSGDAARVDATWQLPLHKVVIARWLGDLAAALGEAHRTSYVPNGIDLEAFRVDRPIDRRAARRVLMLHGGVTLPWKGTADGLAALTEARRRHAGLEVVLFGTARRPPDVPAWIRYERNPHGERLRRLYNETAVFLHPSHAEGWPLPPAEAMACGCALVAAGNPGVLDYATDGSTALVAPVGDVEGLADRIVTLVEDAGRRVALAEAGRTAIGAYTWERAVSRLEAVLAGG